MNVPERVRSLPDSRLIQGGTLIASSISLVLVFGFTSEVMYGLASPVNLIAYWHISLAWAAGIALFVTFLGSIRYLYARTRSWNQIAHASAEVGFVFLTAALVMGSIWGSVIWGVWWSWGDVRLVTMFIAWLVYAGYLVVYTELGDAKGQFAAGYGVVGFVTIPLSFVSTRIWQPELHAPTIQGSSEGTAIDPGTLVVSLVALTLLYLLLTGMRVRIHDLRDGVLRRAGGE